MKEIKLISIIFMVIGALLWLVGLYFNLMQWTDIFRGKVTGPVLLAIGLVLFLIYFLKYLRKR